MFKSWTLFNLLSMVKGNNSQHEHFLPDEFKLFYREKRISSIEKIKHPFENLLVNNTGQLSK